MKDPHLSDGELLMALDGELSSLDAARVAAHLTACWSCRARQAELESAIADFVQVYQQELSPGTARADGARALLRARLGASTRKAQPTFSQLLRGVHYRRVLAVTAILLLAAFLVDLMAVRRPISVVALAAPNPSLTPGAVVLKPRELLCRESLPKNKDVPSQLRRRVLEEYGMARAAEGTYEVDYLITPALGGSDDIRNLWPHSSTNIIWSAKVKDSLEDRLHDLVCTGRLDLPTAQREISTNWIEAYKKYFHSDSPLPDPGRN